MPSYCLSGLSPRFQKLSRSLWAGCLCITHPFASPSLQQAGAPAIDLHVLGTPPAFILSQDQTLHLTCSINIDYLRLFINPRISYINSWRSYFVCLFPVQFSKSFCLTSLEVSLINLPFLIYHVNNFFDFRMRISCHCLCDSDIYSNESVDKRQVLFSYFTITYHSHFPFLFCSDKMLFI